MKKFALLLSLIALVSSYSFAQDEPRLTAEQYIAQFKEAAIADMKKTGVPASITMAQGMFESDYGNSSLAKVAKNHFGATLSNFLKIRLGSRFPLLKSLNFWVRSQRNR